LQEPHNNYNIWFISNLVAGSDPLRRCPGKRAGGEDKNGREATFPFPSISLSAKRRGGKGIAWLETAEARIREKRNHRLFCRDACPFARAGDLYALREILRLPNPIENTAFSKRILFFFSTKMEKIQIF
jgi:hypothetical protein